MVAEEVIVNCYNFNPKCIRKVKKENFQGIFKNYPELEPEPQFRFAAPRSRNRKK
jgi:hypothetical protein